MSVTMKAIKKYQYGVGLIELLVSMFIGLFIMAGVVQMVGTTSQNAISTNGIARIQENARYVFARIEDDLMRAGNAGCFNASVAYAATNVKHNAPSRGLGNNSYKAIDSLLVNTMTSNAALVNELYDYNNIIGGLDLDSNSVTSLGIENTDTFLIRLVDQSERFRVASIPEVGGSLTIKNTSIDLGDSVTGNQVVTIADCDRSVSLITASASGATLTWDTTTVTDQYKNEKLTTGFKNTVPDSQSSALYLFTGSTGAHRYFIDTSVAADGNTCDPTDDNKRYCSLYKIDNGVKKEIVDGVHDMQIEYGYESGGNLTFANAATINADDDLWNAVDRVRLTLSFNSVEPVVLNVADQDKQFAEKSFTRTIALFNQL